MIIFAAHNGTKQSQNYSILEIPKWGMAGLACPRLRQKESLISRLIRKQKKSFCTHKDRHIKLYIFNNMTLRTLKFDSNKTTKLYINCTNDK